MENAINSESTQLCSTCEESSAPELLYKCTQCNIFEDSKKPVEFLCDLCVASHIKKGHRILDHKGQEPTACSEHRQLCLDYCITCAELFCAKCLGKHRKHDFQSLNEKASEVRAKVFDLLTDWEKNEKVALGKNESISKIVDIHKMKVEKLVKEVEDTLDKVKENLTVEIRAKFREFEDVQSWIARHVASVGQAQSDLRGLLCQSNGILVNSFPIVEAKIGALSTSDSQVKLYQMNEEQFEAREGFKSLDQKLFSEMHDQLNLPGVKNESLEPSVLVKKSQFNLKVKIAEMKAEIRETPELSSDLPFKSIVGCFTDSCFEVAQRNRRLEVRKYDTEKRNTSDAVSVCLALPDSFMVERVYYFSGQSMVVGNQPMRPKRAFCCNLKSLHREIYEIPYPLNTDVLGPKKDGWFFWEPVQKSISVWLNSDENIRVITGCQSRPTNHVVSDCDWCCFYDQSSLKINAIAFSSNWAVPRFKHFAKENIECISTFVVEAKLIIVTWSIQSRASSVYVFSKWNLKQPQRVLRLDLLTYASFDVYELQFVLRPLNCDKRDEDKCLFLIERIE